MALTCPDCHRKLPRPRIPKDASPELKAAFEAVSRVCVWCSDVNLLGGGFEPSGLRERWQGPDLKLILEEGAALRRERMKPKARRRAEKKAPAQGSLS